MFLYGASGHAKVIIDILEACGMTVEGLIDDNREKTELSGYPRKPNCRAIRCFMNGRQTSRR